VSLKVAIVSDTMVVLGGAERLVEALADAFPDAPIYCVLYDAKRGPVRLRERIVQSFLSRFPGSTRYAKALLPLFPAAVESFDLSEYDVILSSSHTLAKGALRTSEQVHICYCHTPMRAIWERTHAEVNGVPGFLRPLLRNMFLHLRVWDFVSSARVDHFIANSKITQKRIATHYRRDSTVITPPIDTEHFRPNAQAQVEAGDYYFVAARNVPYKRIDLAIAAAERLGRKLIVAGEGTSRFSGQSKWVTALGKIDEVQFLRLLQGARAFIAPQLEDFGMAMLEANACGRPVIAYGRGGALETQVDGKSGILFDSQSVDSLCEAILRFERTPFDATWIRTYAERFSRQQFISAVRDFVTKHALKPLPKLTAAQFEEHHIPIITECV
jgi:glycosyltransferase involved in cell wall biosynthesis